MQWTRGHQSGDVEDRRGMLPGGGGSRPINETHSSVYITLPRTP